MGRAHPDEAVSGDRFVAHGDDDTFVVALADGLGHGPPAYEAAEAATSAFTDTDALRAPLASLVERAHEMARPTRGAALSVVRVQREPLAVEFVGVGNVEGTVRSGRAGDERKERLFLAGGVVGYRLPTLRTFSAVVNEPLLVALATDGVAPELCSDPALQGPLGVERTAELLFERYASGSDDGLAFLLRVGAGS